MAGNRDAMRRQRELSEVAASISEYYDSLCADEVKEQSLWGLFSEAQFPRI